MSKRIVDLTMLIHEGMQTFPSAWHPFVEVTQLGRHGIENRETRKLVLGTHTGTHLDAPRHFIPDGYTVEHISLEQINGSCILLDFSDVPPKTGLTAEDVKKKANGRSVQRVLFRFDWCHMLGKFEYYTDQPFLEEDAAQWLVDNGCKMIGLDVAMPDNPKNGKGSENDSPNHRIFLGNEVIIVEYLVNLRDITTERFDIVVAPLKIKDGDGAPCRCFAILGDK